VWHLANYSVYTSAVLRDVKWNVLYTAIVFYACMVECYLRFSV